MIRVSFITIILYALNGCVTDDKYRALELWAQNTKETILKQSDFKPDSTSQETKVYYNIDSTRVIQRDVYTHYYLKGHELYYKVDADNGWRAEVFFSIDGKFSFGREICENGQPATEDFTYLDNPVGPSTEYHCNGKMKAQYIYYNGEWIGISRQWNEDGKLLKEQDYENLHLIDSLPMISK
jgi:antitoxin component YwqK of YwqJK toxin-antitoxin module